MEGQGGVTVVHVPSLSSISARRLQMGHCDSSNKKKKQCNWWCAACGGQYPNGGLVIHYSTDRREGKVFRAHAPPIGVCENVLCSLKLLAKQHWEVTVM